MKWAIVAVLALVVAACGSSGPQSKVETPATKQPGAAIVVEKIPLAGGALTVTVWAHSIKTREGVLSAWTYVSDGFAKYDQPEITFTIVRRDDKPDAGFPRDVLDMYTTMFGAITDGGSLREYDMMQWMEADLAGVSDLHGAIFTRPEPFEGVTFPPKAVAAVVVHLDEIMAAGKYSAQRVLARLGQQDRFYPHPTWFDPKRPVVVTAAMSEASVLAKIGSVFVVVGLTVVKEKEERIIISIPSDAHEHVRELPSLAKGVFPARAELDRQADSALVWMPELEGQPSAIHPDGSPIERMSGAYVVAMKGDVDQTRIVEDGYAIIMLDAAWQQLHDALKQKRNVTIPAAGERTEIVLRWID